MQYRRLGDTDLECSILGLGTGRLASLSGGVARDGAARLLDAAIDGGVNLIDTADVYAQGWCERLLGGLLRERRDKVLLSTKAGYRFPDLPAPLRVTAPFVKKIANTLARKNQDFSPARISKCVEASLRRLRTEHLDIFLLHTPPVASMRDEALLESLRAMKTAGKIRHFGVSSHDPAVLQAALDTPGLTVVQAPVNPCSPEVLAMLPKLAARGIGIIANRVFMSGELLGTGAKADALRSRCARLSAGRSGVSALLLQFALAQSGIGCALTGTTNPSHMRENAADLQRVQFSMEELDSLLAPEAA